MCELNDIAVRACVRACVENFSRSVGVGRPGIIDIYGVETIDGRHAISPEFSVHGEDDDDDDHDRRMCY